MNTSTAATQADAQQWRELLALLRQKAYKPTMTPAEIAAELPDLRAIAHQVRARAAQTRGYRQ